MMKVLFVAANADDAVRLKLEREKNCVQDILKDNRRYALEHRGAIQSDELLDWLNRIQPTIFHFSGHGSSDAHLEFVERDDSASAVSAAALARAFRSAPPVPRVVVLNACDSESMVEQLLAVVPCVIAMSAPISDGAAIAFTRGFYGALARAGSLDVGRAFEQGCAQIAMKFSQSGEHEVPKLHGQPFPPADQARSYALNDDFAFHERIKGAFVESFNPSSKRLALALCEHFGQAGSVENAVSTLWSEPDVGERLLAYRKVVETTLKSVATSDEPERAALCACLRKQIGLLAMSAVDAAWLARFRGLAEQFVELPTAQPVIVDLVVSAADDRLELALSGSGSKVAGNRSLDAAFMEAGDSSRETLVELGLALWPQIFPEDPNPPDKAMFAANLHDFAQQLAIHMLYDPQGERVLRYDQLQSKVGGGVFRDAEFQAAFAKMFDKVRVFSFGPTQAAVAGDVPLMIVEGRLLGHLQLFIRLINQYDLPPAPRR